MHRDVRLAREIRIEKETGIEAISKAAVAFKEAGKTEEDLFSNEVNIISRFRKASPWTGVFSWALPWASPSYHWLPQSGEQSISLHQGKCYSCGRCFKYCPVKVKQNI